MEKVRKTKGSSLMVLQRQNTAATLLGHSWFTIYFNILKKKILIQNRPATAKDITFVLKIEHFSTEYLICELQHRSLL